MIVYCQWRFCVAGDVDYEQATAPDAPASPNSSTTSTGTYRAHLQQAKVLTVEALNRDREGDAKGAIVVADQAAEILKQAS